MRDRLPTDRLPPPRRAAGILLAAVVLVSGGAIAASHTFGASGTVVWQSPNGPTVTTTTNITGTTSTPITSNEVDFGPERFASPNPTAVTISGGYDSSELQLTAIDTNGTTLTVDSTGKNTIVLSNGVTGIDIQDVDRSSTSPELTVTGAGGTVAVQGLPSNEYVRVVYTNAPAEIVPTDGSGTATLQLASGDEVSLATTRSPSASNLAPTGGTLVDSSPVELSVDVNDADFSTATGDTVTVRFYDGSGTQVDSVQTSSASTVTGEYAGAVGGSNQWYAELEDSYGNQITTSTETFDAPAEITIRNETSPGEVIGSGGTSVSTELEFYEQASDPTIVTRSTTNGKVNMTGLPADSGFIVVADAPNYTQRRTYVDSLIETQRIYLLHDSEPSSDVVFELDDFSGNYQSESSVLIIERDINGTFTPIQGDFFGATGKWQATLQKNERHRMRIKNVNTGDERVLGQFTPTQDASAQTITIEPEGSVRIGAAFEQITADPALGSIPASQAAAFGVKVREGEQTITNYTITMTHIAPNGSTTTLATRNGSSYGTEEFALDLRDKQGDVTATVDVRTPNGTQTVTIARSIRENYPAADGLLGGLLDIGGELGVSPSGGGSGVAGLLAFLLSTLITGSVVAKTGASAELAGLTALGSLAAFAAIGWLAVDILFAAGVAFGATVILRRGI